MGKWRIVFFIALAIAVVFIFSIRDSENRETNVINIYRFEQSVFSTNESSSEKDI